MMMTKTHLPGQHNEFLKRMGDSELRSTLKNLRRRAIGFQKDYVDSFDFLADPYFGNLLTDHNKDVRKKRPAMSIKYLEDEVDRKTKEEAHVRSRFGDDAPKAVSESGNVQEVDRHLLPRPAYLDKINSLRQHATATLQKNTAPTASRKSYYSSPY